MFPYILTDAAMILSNKTPFIVPRGLDSLETACSSVLRFLCIKASRCMAKTQNLLYIKTRLHVHVLLILQSNIFVVACINVLLSKASLKATLFLDQSTEGKLENPELMIAV